MAGLIDLDLKPSERTLRQFGFIALAGFGALAALAWAESLIFSFGLGVAREPVALALGALALTSLSFSVVYPKANRPIYVGLAILSFPIGFVLSHLILGALFYVVIAPVGLAFRVLGRDPLGRQFLPEASSYWVDAAPARPKDRYFRQF